MYLLDTNVVSELRKVRAGKADPNVSRWADSVNAGELYLSGIRGTRQVGISIKCLSTSDFRIALMKLEFT